MALFVRASVLVLALLICFDVSPAYPATDAETLKEAVREVLRKNPELVMDVLSENSEAVLEIAQQGNLLRKRKFMITQWKIDAAQPKKVDLKDRSFRGDPAAPVTIVAYSDFTCAYCLQAEQTLAQVLKKYPGKVRLTFKALPKDDPYAIAAAKYGTAAFLLDPARGWEFFDAMFNGMARFEREGDNFLKEIAAAHGYDFKKLKSESGGARVKARLDEDRKEADDLGIAGTPHFLVNDLMVRGAISPDLFEEAVEMALRHK